MTDASTFGLKPPTNASSFGLRPPSEEQSSAVKALGQGFVHGLGNTLYGGAQIGARMQEPTAFSDPDPNLATRVDEATKTREQQYGASPAVKAHPVVSGIGDVGGELVATAPLAAFGGAAAPATVAGRLGASAALGAVSGLAQPTDKMSVGAKVKQAALGAVGGSAGAAVGEAGGAILSKAIARNSPAAIDNLMLKQFRTTVKPSRVGRQTSSQMKKQDQQIVGAIDSIVANRSRLMLTDEAGNTVQGELPKNLRQFSEAIEQTKGGIFAQYDQMQKAAGQTFAQVDILPAAQELLKAASKPENVDFHPTLASEASKLANTLIKRGSYSASETQAVIQNLNRTLNGFWRNPTHETVSRASMLAPVVSKLREQLDTFITSAVGPGYQELRNKYAALKSVEKDVAAAAQREGNKIVGGIGGIFSDLAASEEAIRGVFTLNPAALLRAGTIKSAQLAMRYINSPNRAITRLFEHRANPSSTPSATQSVIGSGIRSATPIASVAQSPLTGALAASPP